MTLFIEGIVNKMFKRNICYLLLILVMLTTCIVPAILESSMVHAATNQEQVNGIEYVNKKLGFSLIIPKSWEGIYEIEEDNNLVRFVFTYEGKKNDDIPPLFTIKYDTKKEEGWNEGIRWVSELGTKNNMGYYCYYDALHLYRDSIPPGEEQDTVLNMLGQIPEVFDSFKMLETNETGAKGDTAGEVKPKEQGKNGGTAEEETNQETANGIKYINGELGFEITLPKFWENHYIVEENDSGGVTFKFKFDGKVYDDIYLFNIYVENREYSEEEQETMGDIGVLDVKNGKTYLITENLAMDYYNNYDEYFASVPKEGRDVIKAMSKQMGDIKFKVLEGAVAEEAKEGEVSNEQPPAEEKVSYEEFCSQFGGGDGDAFNMCNNFLTFKDYIGERIDAIAKQSRYTADSIWSGQKFSKKSDYSFYIEPRLADPSFLTRFYIIKTPIDNIRTEVIRKRVSETSYTGINGGFLELKHDKETNKIYKLDSRNISYYSGAIDGLTSGLTDGSTENYNYNGTREKPTSRPTFVTYYDKDLRKMKAEIIHDITSMDEINNHFKNLHNNDHNHHDNQVIINAIGGKNFEKDHWGYGSNSDYYWKPARRTVLGYKEEEGNVYAYLMVTDIDTTVAGLKWYVEKLGFNKNNSIVLDGSGSTSMRVKMPNGRWFIDKGKEPPLLDLFQDADRPVYNMIRLINDTPR